MICKYFLTFYKLSFHCVDSIIWCTDFNGIYLVHFSQLFATYAFDAISKKVLPI